VDRRNSAAKVLWRIEESPVARDPEQIAATLRQLARLDLVELGHQALPTSLGHGWRHRPSQPLPSRTAPTVLTSSTPASSRPSANCTRPWAATPDDLASLPADMERSSVAVGKLVGAGTTQRVAAGQTSSFGDDQRCVDDLGGAWSIPGWVMNR
jgi:hypothetical protein